MALGQPLLWAPSGQGLAWQWVLAAAGPWVLLCLRICSESLLHVLSALPLECVLCSLPGGSQTALLAPSGPPGMGWAWPPALLYILAAHWKCISSSEGALWSESVIIKLQILPMKNAMSGEGPGSIPKAND